MELLTSLRLFVWGNIKRWYYLLPALCTDPFDFAERWFKVTYESPQYLVWVLVAIGFAIASIATYHELRTQKLKAESLLNAKPAITVLPEADGCLRVENNGGEGRFRAKAQMLWEGHPEESQWFIKWGNSLEIEQIIHKGDNAILEVASYESEIVYTNDRPRRIRPFISIPSGRRVVSREGTQEIQIFDRNLSPKDKSIRIEVRIFSTPEMFSPFKQRYLIKLTPDDDTVSIEEVLNEL